VLHFCFNAGDIIAIHKPSILYSQLRNDIDNFLTQNFKIHWLISQNLGATEPTSAESEEQSSPSKDKKSNPLESGKDKPQTPSNKEDHMEVEELHAVEHFNEAQISDIVV
jgi:hypothetical protein